MIFLLILGFLLTLLLGWELNERLLERKRLASAFSVQSLELHFEQAVVHLA